MAIDDWTTAAFMTPFDEAILSPQKTRGPSSQLTPFYICLVEPSRLYRDDALYTHSRGLHNKDQRAGILSPRRAARPWLT